MAKKVNPPATPEVKPEQLQTLAGIGATADEAVLILGLSHEQWDELLASPAHAAAWNTGRAVVDSKVAEQLLRNALAGNLQAQQFWLQSRQPERWGKKAAKSEEPAEPLDNLKLQK